MPCFRILVCCCSKPSQAGFYHCILRWVPDPPEPTFGRPCYLFEGVAPHPNCPSIDVPPKRLGTRSQKGSVSWSPRRQACACAWVTAPTYTAHLRSYPNDRLQSSSTGSSLSSREFWTVRQNVIFTGLQAGTVGPSLILHASRQLSGKVLRYLKRVIVTPAVYRSFHLLYEGFRYQHWAGFDGSTNPFGLAAI